VGKQSFRSNYHRIWFGHSPEFSATIEDISIVKFFWPNPMVKLLSIIRMPVNRGIPLAEFHKKSCIGRHLRPHKREDTDLLEELDIDYDLIVIGAGPSGLSVPSIPVKRKGRHSSLKKRNHRVINC
jgi:hypothetical protein